MLLDSIEEAIETCDVHIGGVDECGQLVVFIPYLLFEDSFRGNGEAVATDKISFALVTEVGVVLEEVFESVFARLKFAVLVFKHANGAASVDNEDLDGGVGTSNGLISYFTVLLLGPLRVDTGRAELLVVFDFASELVGIGFAIEF